MARNNNNEDSPDSSFVNVARPSADLSVQLLFRVPQLASTLYAQVHIISPMSIRLSTMSDLKSTQRHALMVGREHEAKECTKEN
jgi:hypothetical protein